MLAGQLHNEKRFSFIDYCELKCGREWLIMFERMKLKKETTNLFNLLYEKASDCEELVSLSCSIILFPNNNQKYLSYNKFTKTECLIYMGELLNALMDDFYDNSDIELDSFIDWITAIKDNNSNCINYTIVDYLGFSMDDFKKMRSSRSSYYYFSAYKNHTHDGFDVVSKLITDAFSDLLANDIHSNNPLDADYKKGKLLIPFTEMTEISIESNAFRDYTILQIKKALTPLFKKAGF